MFEAIKITYNQSVTWLLFFTSFISFFACPYVVWYLHSEVIHLSDIFCSVNNAKIKQALLEGEWERQLLVFCLCVWFLMCLPIFFLMIKRILQKNRYALIASADGLWLDRFGLILWNQINRIYLFTDKQQGSFVVVQLHDISFLKLHVSWFAQFQLYMFSLSEKNSIYLTGLAIDNKILIKQLNICMATQKNKY